MKVETPILLANRRLLAKVNRENQKVNYFIKAETWRTWNNRNCVLIKEVELNGRDATVKLLSQEADKIIADIESGVINENDIRAPYLHD